VPIGFSALIPIGTPRATFSAIDHSHEKYQYLALLYKCSW